MTTQRKTMFKVVDRKTRRGTNFAIAEWHNFSYEPSSYIKTYEKGTIVRAKEGSLGIFTFKTKKAALKFMKPYSSLSYTAIVLRVEPIGKGKTPTRIAGGGSILDYILKFYSNKLGRKIPPPKGTICYPAVRVLN